MAAVSDSRLLMKPIAASTSSAMMRRSSITSVPRSIQNAPHSKPIGPTMLNGSSPMGSAKRCSSSEASTTTTVNRTASSAASAATATGAGAATGGGPPCRPIISPAPAVRETCLMRPPLARRVAGRRGSAAKSGSDGASGSEAATRSLQRARRARTAGL